MFGEQHFLPDSIISIWTKVVFLSLKEKSASKSLRIIIKYFSQHGELFWTFHDFKIFFARSLRHIGRYNKKRFTKCSDFNVVERKFLPARNRRVYGKHWEFFRIGRNFCKYFGETSARRSTVVRRVTSLKDIIKVGYDAYTYRLIHSACFSVLLAVCASCLPRVPMAARLSTGLKVSFEHARGFVLGERLLSVRMFARCISCSTVLPLRIRRVTVIRGSGILGTETPFQAI